jgi:hypothetical protein
MGIGAHATRVGTGMHPINRAVSRRAQTKASEQRATCTRRDPPPPHTHTCTCTQNGIRTDHTNLVTTSRPYIYKRGTAQYESQEREQHVHACVCAYVCAGNTNCTHGLGRTSRRPGQRRPVGCRLRCGAESISTSYHRARRVVRSVRLGDSVDTGLAFIGHGAVVGLTSGLGPDDAPCHSRSGRRDGNTFDVLVLVIAREPFKRHRRQPGEGGGG